MQTSATQHQRSGLQRTLISAPLQLLSARLCLRRDGGRVMSHRAPKLAADVVALVASYRPECDSDGDVAKAVLPVVVPAVLPVVMPLVRAWVTAAAPASVSTAKTLLWATTRLAVWAYLTLSSVDPTVVLHPHNVQHFTTVVCKKRSQRYRHAARSALCRVGRAANPDGWDPLVPEFGRKGVPAPYSYETEAGFGLAAVMPGRSHRVARMWVVVGSLGAGLLGPQIAEAGPQNLVAMIGGRVGVQIGGDKPRLVPVRAAYTDLALRASQAADGDRFITGKGRNAVTSVTGRLTVAGEGLSLRRARVSWLAAHVTAGTNLAALHIISGRAGAQTLDSVLAHVAADMSPQDAAIEGLKA